MGRPEAHNWPHILDEAVAEGRCAVEVADTLGVTPRAVCKAAERHGRTLPAHVRPDFHDWSAIFAYASEHGLSAMQIADHFNLSLTAVYNSRSRYGVKLADGRARRRIHPHVDKDSPDAVDARISKQQSRAANARWAKRAATRGPDLPGEEWRPCRSWPGYEASSAGRVRSQFAVLAGTFAVNGYPMASPSINGRQSPIGIHRMVADAFLGPRQPGMEVRHMDGDRSNSRPDNLEWGTRQDNMLDKIRHGTSNHGERNVNAKLTSETALEVFRRAIAGESPATLAALYGIDRSQVSAIKTGRSWAHVTGVPAVRKANR